MLKVEWNRKNAPRQRVLRDIPVGTVFTYGSGDFLYLKVNSGYVEFGANRHWTDGNVILDNYRELSATLTVEG
jgi:hypothetical protein